MFKIAIAFFVYVAIGSLADAFFLGPSAHLALAPRSFYVSTSDTKKTGHGDDASSVAKEVFSQVKKTVGDVRSALSTPEAQKKIGEAKSEASYRIQDAMEKSKDAYSSLHASATSPETKEKVAGLQAGVSKKLQEAGELGKKLINDAAEEHSKKNTH